MVFNVSQLKKVSDVWKNPFVPVNGQLAPTHAIINIVVVDAGRNCTLEFVMEHTSEYFFGFYWAEVAEYLIKSVADKKLALNRTRFLVDEQEIELLYGLRNWKAKNKVKIKDGLIWHYCDIFALIDFLLALYLLKSATITRL